MHPLLKNTLRVAALGTILAVLLSISVPPVIGVPEYTRLNSPDSDLTVQERDPAIGEDFIVWTSRTPFLSDSIQIRHIQSGRQESLSDLPGAQLNPVAVGREVFWIQKYENEDDASLVMRKVLATGEESQLSDEKISSRFPLVASEWGWVAWTPWSEDSIAVDNINGDDMFEIAASEGYEIQEYALAQDLLVWIESKGDESRIMSRGLPSGRSVVAVRSENPISGLATNGVKIAWTEKVEGLARLIMQDRAAQDDILTGREIVSELTGTIQPPVLTADRVQWIALFDEEWRVWSKALDGSAPVYIHQGDQPIHSLTARRDLIAWTEERGAEAQNVSPDTDIVAAKLLKDDDASEVVHASEPTVISTELPGAASHLSPASDGDWAVWLDNRRDRFGIFGRELSGEEEMTMDISKGGDPKFPAVDWPLVAWADGGRDNPAVRIKNIESNEELSLPQVGLAGGLQLSESILLWSQFTQSTGQLIYSQREGPGLRGFSEPQIIVQDSSSVRFFHHLYEDIAVWTQAGASPDIGDFRIIAMDLSTGSTIDVARSLLFDADPTATPLGVFWLDNSPSDSRTTTKLRRWSEVEFGLEPEETVIAAESMTLAGTSGDSLIYLDHSNDKHAMKALDITTKLETILFESEQSMTNPVIAKDYILWQDQREGSSNVYASSLSGQEIPRTQINSRGTKLGAIKFVDPLAPVSNGPGCSLF